MIVETREGETVPPETPRHRAENFIDEEIVRSATHKNPPGQIRRMPRNRALSNSAEIVLNAKLPENADARKRLPETYSASAHSRLTPRFGFQPGVHPDAHHSPMIRST